MKDTITLGKNSMNLRRQGESILLLHRMAEGRQKAKQVH